MNVGLSSSSASSAWKKLAELANKVPVKRRLRALTASERRVVAPIAAALGGAAVAQLAARLVASRTTHRPGAPLATVAIAAGAIAVGALAVGAMSVGALAIARLAVRSARIKHLRIDVLEVRETVGAPVPATPSPS
jgi:hypothetical protein